MNLLTLEEQLLNDPRFADHPDWQARAERALKAADRIMFDRCGDLRDFMWGIFWDAVPDAWMEANTWRTLAARNAAVRDYLRDYPAGTPPDVHAMLDAYFKAAPDPAPELRNQEEAS